MEKVRIIDKLSHKLIRMFLIFLALLFTGSLMMSCKTKKAIQENNSKDIGNSMYSNPVISSRLPDPTVTKAKDGFYYLFATEDTRNVPIWKSKDMIQWTFIGTAFTDETRPDFLPNGGIWAPEINYINGKYVLHYSMSEWGGHWDAGIGVAVSEKPEGPFKDLGKIFDSRDVDVENSIDQFYIEDGNRKYLFWGSFHGIYSIELTGDGLQIKPGAQKVKIAGSAYEGTAIHKRGDYYYFFGSVGACCKGLKSTYSVVYGRSKSLHGPYLNKNGENLMDNKYDVLIENSDQFIGNGHNSRIVQDDAGNDWMFYHAYEKEKSAQWDRFLMLSEVKWDEEDWPYVVDGRPRESAPIPVIDKE